MSWPDLNALDLDGLFDALVDARRLRSLLDLAFAEDLGEAGDVTTLALVPPGVTVRAAIVARSDGVVAGLRVVERVLEERGESLSSSVLARDGERCAAGQRLVEISGSLAALLPLERTILNALGRLSGVATRTAQFVERTRGTHARISCTRKTTPGLRELEKYAVRCGGGWLHRIGLYDAILVKDNHLAGIAKDGIGPALERALREARRRWPLRFVEVEVDSLAQLDAILAFEPGAVDIVLLDNFAHADLREAVRRRGDRPIELEASGGITLESVRAAAETGVDRISVGSLTHGAASLDVALDLP